MHNQSAHSSATIAAEIWCHCFGQVCAGCERISGEPCANICPNFVETQTNLAGVGNLLAGVGSICRVRPKHRPKSTDIGQISAERGRTRPNSAEEGSSCAAVGSLCRRWRQIGQSVDNIWAAVRVRPEIARTRPTLGRNGPHSAELKGHTLPMSKIGRAARTRNSCAISSRPRWLRSRHPDMGGRARAHGLTAALRQCPLSIWAPKYIDG